VRIPVLRLLVGAVILVGWQVASGWLVPEAFVSTPLAVASQLWEIIVDGTAWYHLEYTGQEFIIGYVIGAAFGISVGTILGRSQLLSDVMQPYILAFYSIPKIALAPLFIIWLGIGIESKIAVVVVSAFFMTFVNTYAGMKSLNEEYVQLVQIMGANRWQVARRVLFPAAAPYIIIGLRSAVPYAVIGAIIGEMIASSRGLGFYIVQASGYLNTTALFAGLVLLVAIVMLVNWLLSIVERRLLVWQPRVENNLSV
jgi:NitT/TauT family transport system permease protein